MQVNIPTTMDSNTAISIEIVQKLVIIGANGSGKSRVGAYLEKQHGEQAVRVTAQKSLEIPDIFTIITTQSAYNSFRYGSERGFLQYREGDLYSGNPTGKTVQDFTSLLQLLFARDSEAAKQVRIASDSGTYDRNNPIQSELQKIKAIWERVLPHRQLNIDLEGQLRASKKDEMDTASATEYLAGQMSDGERVAFYLLGKCLVAPTEAILIIDEPELHLHPTIRDSLWGALETERPDCTFIYITHDIDFALSRMEDQAIWLQSYDGTHWEYELITRGDALPENLHLTLLGSRRPILFVEGEKGGLDERLYSALYPDFLIQPCGSCKQVVQYTRAARQLQSFHHMLPMGLIDADNLNNQAKQQYKQDGIYTLACVEIENLFWAPEVLEVMTELENLPDAKNSAIQRIIDEVQKLLEPTVAAKVGMLLQSSIQWRSPKTLEAVRADIEQIKSFDVETVAEDFRSQINRAVKAKSLQDLMRLVEYKHLHCLIAEDFGLKAKRYADKVLSVLKGNKKEEKEKMVAAFKNYIPDITIDSSPRSSD
jgi:energy-coupling factor transporter ATP-binding protein EcfA2